MDKKWLWFLLGIAIPCLLNLIFYFEVIPSSLSSNSWLGFWGGYLGGAATLAAFFLSNKTTKLVVLRQWEEKKFVEYRNSLLDNLKLLNTVEILNGISNVSLDTLDEKFKIITKKKQEIYSCDIAFRTISMVDLGNIKKEEKHQKTDREVLDSVSHSLPSLIRADKVGSKARKLGYDDHASDFENASSEFTKIYENMNADKPDETPEEVEAAVGKLLFTAVQIAHRLGVDPEKALGDECDRVVADAKD